MKKIFIIGLSLLLTTGIVYAAEYHIDHNNHNNHNMHNNHNDHNMHNNNNHNMHNMHNNGQPCCNMNHNGGHGGHHNHNTSFKANEYISFTKPLLIPALVKGNLVNGVRNFNLEANKGSWEFLNSKKTETYGYNGSILGPVLLLNKGEKNRITIKNNLSDETTVHWHGAIVSHDVDGVHNANILPNKSRTVEFTLNQPAATLWYHPHTMHKTAGQVYKGLAGLIYLEDKESSKLDLPKTYGVNDFPVVIQDKKLSEDGMLDYKVSHMETMHGKSGGYLMVNGVISPYLNIPNGIIRLRIVNGSNATNYDITLSGRTFYQIASDGGLLKKPVSHTILKLSPGERAEILINSKDLKATDYLYVNNTKAMEFRKTKDKSKGSIPAQLVNIPNITSDLKNLKVRDFVLSTNHNGNTINGRLFDINRTDFNVKKGTEEIWNISNNINMMDMPHPFHIHGTQFRVIERNGKIPPLNEQGWKDTVNVEPGENVKVLVKYTVDGIMMYHCHILEHEESGMMGQFMIK